MKKSMLLIGLLASSITAMANNNDHSSINKISGDNTFYLNNSKKVLKENGYEKVQVTGQLKGYCTIAQDKFDWNAASFVALKNNVQVKGVVCSNEIYLKEVTKK